MINGFDCKILDHTNASKGEDLVFSLGLDVSVDLVNIYYHIVYFYLMYSTKYLAQGNEFLTHHHGRIMFQTNGAPTENARRP